MNRSRWRWAVGMASAAAVLVPAGLAWACLGLISLTTSSPTVQPGGTVTVTGRNFAQGSPVAIHLDSPTGPVLATVPPPSKTMTSQFSLDVAIPADVPPGQHVLVATQEYHNMNAGAPARALLSVGTAPPPAPGSAARPARLIASSGPSKAALVSIAVAVALVGLILAALANRSAARRDAQPASS